jgi:hypothetical protein
MASAEQKELLANPAPCLLPGRPPPKMLWFTLGSNPDIVYTPYKIIKEIGNKGSMD